MAHQRDTKISTLWGNIHPLCHSCTPKIIIQKFVSSRLGRLNGNIYLFCLFVKVYSSLKVINLCSACIKIQTCVVESEYGRNGPANMKIPLLYSVKGTGSFI